VDGPAALRVAHVSTEFSGGVEPDALLRRYRVVTELLAALSQTPAIEVAGFQRFDRTHLLEWQGVAVHFLGEPGHTPAPALLDPLHAFARPLAAFRPHVIHVQGLRDVANARWLSWYAGGAPLLLQHRAETPASRRLRWLRPLFRGVQGFAFTAAEFAGEFMDAGFIGPGQHTFEVPGGSCGFSPVERGEARLRLGVEGDPAVLWVGRLEPVKAPEVALGGFVALAKQRPRSILYVVGPAGAAADRLHADVAASGLAGRVRFVGPVAHGELPVWFSAADVFVTAAPRESTNLALIEAMACGCPAVMSDIAAHRALTDGWSVGYPFTAGSPAACGGALAMASERVLASSEPRLAARRHFERRLSWPAVAERFAEAYRALAATACYT
jgi:glycosyltransferase involved in cell wall biosynthesis